MEISTGTHIERDTANNVTVLDYSPNISVRYYLTLWIRGEGSRCKMSEVQGFRVKWTRLS